MSPEYIYENMTWNEINDALEYVFRYSEPKVPFYKRYQRMGLWMYPNKDLARKELQNFKRKLKRGKNS